MSLDATTVRRIAKLARLHITDEEATRLQAELSGILGWIEQLNEVDTSAVDPLVGTASMGLRLREDRITEDLTGGNRSDAILANAPGRAGHYFTVPKVVE